MTPYQSYSCLEDLLSIFGLKLDDPLNTYLRTALGKPFADQIAILEPVVNLSMELQRTTLINLATLQNNHRMLLKFYIDELKQEMA